MGKKYTEEEIQLVCNAAYEIMGQFTEVKNCVFPSTAIRKGMEAGLSSEEIACNAYDVIAKLSLHQTGFGLVGMGDSMHNIALYMQNEIKKRIDALNGPVFIPPPPMIEEEGEW
jgi:hypothetical protein